MQAVKAYAEEHNLEQTPEAINDHLRHSAFQLLTLLRLQYPKSSQGSDLAYWISVSRTSGSTGIYQLLRRSLSLSAPDQTFWNRIEGFEAGGVVEHKSLTVSVRTKITSLVVVAYLEHGIDRAQQTFDSECALAML